MTFSEKNKTKQKKTAVMANRSVVTQASGWGGTWLYREFFGVMELYCILTVTVVT